MTTMISMQAQKRKAQPGEDQTRQQELCSAAAGCLSHMCQHSSARPAVQKAGGIIMLATLCDAAQQQPLEVVRNASAALASITVEAAVKVSLPANLLLILLNPYWSC